MKQQRRMEVLFGALVTSVQDLPDFTLTIWKPHCPFLSLFRPASTADSVVTGEAKGVQTDTQPNIFLLRSITFSKLFKVQWSLYVPPV
jgi:hypothetical protein